MKKEVKIILCSGISITLTDKDEIDLTVLSYDTLTNEQFAHIKEIPRLIIDMDKEGLVFIKHKTSTGEYMEYTIPRDKITWCYYSEVPENNEE